MPLTKASLEGRIVSAMEAQGANAEGEHSWVNKMASAIAQAVVEEITSNGQVVIASGSSAGTYKVQ
jgi:hypothetical protein